MTSAITRDKQANVTPCPPARSPHLLIHPLVSQNPRKLGGGHLVLTLRWAAGIERLTTPFIEAFTEFREERQAAVEMALGC